MYTHACPCTSLVLMTEEEEEIGPGFSRLHLNITDHVHQWQGDNDAIKSHGRLYDVFTVELANLSSFHLSTLACIALCCFALAERADKNTVEAQTITCDGFKG